MFLRHAFDVTSAYAMKIPHAQKKNNNALVKHDLYLAPITWRYLHVDDHKAMHLQCTLYNATTRGIQGASNTSFIKWKAFAGSHGLLHLGVFGIPLMSSTDFCHHDVACRRKHNYK